MPIKRIQSSLKRNALCVSFGGERIDAGPVLAQGLDCQENMKQGENKQQCVFEVRERG